MMGSNDIISKKNIFLKIKITLKLFPFEIEVKNIVCLKQTFYKIMIKSNFSSHKTNDRNQTSEENCWFCKANT